ncbi:hypothetical protein HNP86_002030 [Methanococcus maripaludis]|uniref:Uncharacterized protein n=1 Tax=Methanococcus maripaludis TaxID=39152 RepID=A0A7J9NX50_METMI|nr:hypothetical protein [Methanococcus maripaludis]MBA2851871.1 hypothetical protein [Methanococcus maripaludis]
MKFGKPDAMLTIINRVRARHRRVIGFDIKSDQGLVNINIACETEIKSPHKYITVSQFLALVSREDVSIRIHEYDNPNGKLFTAVTIKGYPIHENPLSDMFVVGEGIFLLDEQRYELHIPGSLTFNYKDWAIINGKIYTIDDNTMAHHTRVDELPRLLDCLRNDSEVEHYVVSELYESAK